MEQKRFTIGEAVRRKGKAFRFRLVYWLPIVDDVRTIPQEDYRIPRVAAWLA